MPHTLILLQPTQNPSSRTYRDFQTITQACDYFINEFEVKLKKLNPNVARINYEPADLNKYIDSMADLGALVFEQQINAYRPHDKIWMKRQLSQRLVERYAR